MSDATWDMEYHKARELREKIINLCEKNNIAVPDINKRSWILEETLKKLETIVKKKNSLDCNSVYKYPSGQCWGYRQQDRKLKDGCVLDGDDSPIRTCMNCTLYLDN